MVRIELSDCDGGGGGGGGGIPAPTGDPGFIIRTLIKYKNVMPI